jgi:hypothetical protein
MSATISRFKFSIAFRVAGGQLLALLSGRSTGSALVSGASADRLRVQKQEFMAESIVATKRQLNN